MHSFPEAQTVDKVEAIRNRANKLFHDNVDWAVFFREVLGAHGIVHELYREPEALAQFQQTPEYDSLQQMLARLRERSGPKAAPSAAASPGDEITRVITVRLPKSLHESLKDEAHKRRTSMNQLCISKLLQVLEQQLAESEEAGEEHRASA